MSGRKGASLNQRERAGEARRVVEVGNDTSLAFPIADIKIGKRHRKVSQGRASTPLGDAIERGAEIQEKHG